jgi:hypothetical protein
MKVDLLIEANVRMTLAELKVVRAALSESAGSVRGAHPLLLDIEDALRKEGIK